jgi:hypothetical protein
MVRLSLLGIGALAACAQQDRPSLHPSSSHKPVSITSVDQITDPGAFASNHQSKGAVTFFAADQQLGGAAPTTRLYQYRHDETTPDNAVVAHHAVPLPGRPQSIAVGPVAAEPVLAIGGKLYAWSASAYQELKGPKLEVPCLAGSPHVLLGLAKKGDKLALLQVDQPNMSYAVAHEVGATSLRPNTVQLVGTAGAWRLGCLVTQGSHGTPHLLDWEAGKAPTLQPFEGADHLVLGTDHAYLALAKGGKPGLVRWANSQEADVPFPTDFAPTAIHGLAAWHKPGDQPRLWVLASDGTKTALLRTGGSGLEVVLREGLCPPNERPRLFEGLGSALSFVSGKARFWNLGGKEPPYGPLDFENLDDTTSVETGFAHGDSFLFPVTLKGQVTARRVVLGRWACH